MNKVIPTHVAIIMDGNGRWAKKRGLPRNYGHQKGAENLLKIVRIANKMQIKYLTVFAFSTENWKRPQEEVKYLMDLPFQFLEKTKKEFTDDNIRVKVIGTKDNLSEDLIKKIEEVESSTNHNTALTLIIAFNYGGKEEIIHAIKKIKNDNIDITEENFHNYLYTKDIPDVDLLILTSGEYRISNFLLWQTAYSELYFTDVLWPDFDKKCFEEAINEYNKRERRFGGLK
ncbi:MAG TPA: isoprenyl transferase [Bacilli bacterium]